MDDICQILNEISVSDVKDIRKEVDELMKGHGFNRVRTLGPKHFNFKILKTNRRLMKFFAENFAAKLPDLDDSVKLHMDTYCKVQKGALSVTLMSIPSQGLVFYSTNEEHGLSAYLVTLEQAIDLHDRVLRDGLDFGTMEAFIG